ncbi:MAG: hypothetical protein ACLQBB_03170 [Solirubrobacteraceae bacterium]
MSYTNADARGQLLGVVGEAADHLSTALGMLAGAYELLDERSADQLEEQLFRPVQLAYGRLLRTHTEFAARHEVPTREFVAAPQGAPARGVRGLLDGAVDAIAAAERELATLQDSMLPVEVGDQELRAGLAEVRTMISGIGARARELERTIGR